MTAAPKPTDPRVPAHTVRWLLNRTHIATPYATVAHDIARRIPGSAPDEVAAATIRFALEQHRHNRGEFAWVMGGLTA